MAVKIRLSRGGSKKRPFYKMVVAEASAPRDGRFIEKVGTYNPMLPADSKERVTLVADRIKYWLSVGAQPTDRVARFLGMAKIIAMPEVRESPVKSQPKEKAKMRIAEKEQKALDAAEAAKAPVVTERTPEPEEGTVEIGEDVPEKVEEVVEPGPAPAAPEAPENVEVDVAVEGADEVQEKMPEGTEE